MRLSFYWVIQQTHQDNHAISKYRWPDVDDGCQRHTEPEIKQQYDVLFLIHTSAKSSSVLTPGLCCLNTLNDESKKWHRQEINRYGIQKYDFICIGVEEGHASSTCNE